MKEKTIRGKIDGNVEFDGKIIVSGKCEVTGNIFCEDLDIYAGGYISAGGDISFSYYLKFGTKITAKLLRGSSNLEIERAFWIEKFNLFGFKKLAAEIKTGCVAEIRAKLQPWVKKLRACKLWTETERLVIGSWIDGKLEYKKK